MRYELLISRNSFLLIFMHRMGGVRGTRIGIGWYTTPAVFYEWQIETYSVTSLYEWQGRTLKYLGFQCLRAAPMSGKQRG